MGIALWCVLLAGLMPYAWTGVAKARGKRFDNRNPRAWQSKLEGLPARAHAAHQNGFEAFPLFAAAVFTALLVGANGTWLDGFAVLFVASRIGFGFAYLADQATLRSLLWFLGMVATLAIFGLAAFSAG